MPRIPELGLPDAPNVINPSPRAEPSGAGIRTAGAFQTLGNQIQDLALDNSIRIKKRDDIDYVLKTRQDLFEKSRNNLEELKKNNPSGEGIEAAQSDYMEKLYGEAQKAAPSETARKSLIAEARPHLDAQIFDAKQYQEKVIGYHSEKATQDSLEEAGVALINDPNLDRLKNSKSAIGDALNGKAAIGQLPIEAVERQKENIKNLSKALAQGRLDKMKAATDLGQKATYMKDTFRLMDNSSPDPRDPDKGILAQDMTADEVYSIRTQMQAELESARSKNEYKIQDTQTQIVSSYQNLKPSESYSAEHKQQVKDIMYGTNWDPRKKANYVTELNLNKALTDTLQGYELSKSDKTLDALAGDFERNLNGIQADTNSITGNTISKDDLLNAKEKFDVKAKLGAMIAKVEKERNENLPDFAIERRKDLQSMEQQIFGANGVDRNITRQYLAEMDAVAKTTGSTDSKRMSSGLASLIATKMAVGSPSQRTDILTSFISSAPNTETADRIVSQLIEQQKMPPAMAASMLVYTPSARDFIMADAADVDLEKRDKIVFKTEGVSSDDFETTVYQHPKLVAVLDAMKADGRGSDAQAFALERAFYNRAVKRLETHMDVNKAADAAATDLNMDLMAPIQIGDTNNVHSMIILPAADSTSRTLIEKNLREYQKPESLKEMGVDVNPEWVKELKQTIDDASAEIKEAGPGMAGVTGYLAHFKKWSTSKVLESADTSFYEAASPYVSWTSSADGSGAQAWIKLPKSGTYRKLTIKGNDYQVSYHTMTTGGEPGSINRNVYDRALKGKTQKQIETTHTATENFGTMVKKDIKKIKGVFGGG